MPWRSSHAIEIWRLWYFTNNALATYPEEHHPQSYTPVSAGQPSGWKLHQSWNSWELLYIIFAACNFPMWQCTTPTIYHHTPCSLSCFVVRLLAIASYAFSALPGSPSLTVPHNYILCEVHSFHPESDRGTCASILYHFGHTTCTTHLTLNLSKMWFHPISGLFIEYY